MKFLSKYLDRQKYFYHKEDDGSFVVYDKGTEKLGVVWETKNGWIATLGEGQPNLEGGPTRESATAVLEMAAQVKKNCKHLRLDNSRIYASNPPQKKCLDCGKFVKVRNYVDVTKALQDMKKRNSKYIRQGGRLDL